MRGYVMVGTNDLKLSEEFYDKLLELNCCMLTI